MLPPTCYYCEKCYVRMGEYEHDWRPSGQKCNCGGTYVNLYSEYNPITKVITPSKPFTFLELVEKRVQYIRQQKLKRILK